MGKSLLYSGFKANVCKTLLYSRFQAKLCTTFLALALLISLFACFNAFNTNQGPHAIDVLSIGATEIIVDIWSQDPISHLSGSKFLNK